MGSQASVNTNDKEQQLKKSIKNVADPFTSSDCRTGGYFPVIQFPDRFSNDG